MSKCLLTYALYNIFPHPLAKYNGPLLWQAFRLPFVIPMVTGDLPHQVKKLHDHYGTVVCVGPNELSLMEPTA